MNTPDLSKAAQAAQGAKADAMAAANQLKNSAVDGINALRDTLKKDKSATGQKEANLKDKLTHVAKDGLEAAAKLGDFIADKARSGSQKLGK